MWLLVLKTADQLVMLPVAFQRTWTRHTYMAQINPLAFNPYNIHKKHANIHHQARSAARSGPIIQELGEEEDAYEYAAAQQPVVEEPDEHEEDDQHEPEQQQQQQQQQQQPMYNHPQFPSLLHGMFPPFGGLPFGGLPFGSPYMMPQLAPTTTAHPTTASYSFSSYSSSSNGNVTYSKTTTTRIGPSGVAETTEAVHDGRTGERRNRVARRLGDREHVVASTYTGNGYQEHQETLNNIRDEQERRQFEHEWTQQQPSLLGTRGRSHSLRGPSFERSVQPRLEDGRALGGGRTGW